MVELETKLTKLQRLQKLELALTTRVVEHFYVVQIEDERINLQGVYSPQILLNICDAFEVDPTEWIVQKSGFLYLELDTFNVDGEIIDLKFILTH